MRDVREFHVKWGTTRWRQVIVRNDSGSPRYSCWFRWDEGFGIWVAVPRSAVPGMEALVEITAPSSDGCET